jgi:hypothetical protein
MLPCPWLLSRFLSFLILPCLMVFCLILSLLCCLSLLIAICETLVLNIRIFELDETRQGRARQDTRQDKTTQHTTRRHKTRQGKARQGRTIQHTTTQETQIYCSYIMNCLLCLRNKRQRHKAVTQCLMAAQEVYQHFSVLVLSYVSCFVVNVFLSCLVSCLI